MPTFCKADFRMCLNRVIQEASAYLTGRRIERLHVQYHPLVHANALRRGAAAHASESTQEFAGSRTVRDSAYALQRLKGDTAPVLELSDTLRTANRRPCLFLLNAASK